MDRKYNLRLDLQFRCNNSKMTFNEFDNDTSDFFMRITRGGELFNIDNTIVALCVIKPDGSSDAEFINIKDGKVYANLPNNLKDIPGTYKAKALLVLNNEKVVVGPIEYEVDQDNIISKVNREVQDDNRFTILTDMISRLSTVENAEELRKQAEINRGQAEKLREEAIEKIKSDTTKLISDTKKEIADYKNTKDTAINEDLTKYKQDTNQAIDNYKSAKDTEINNILGEYKTNTTDDIEEFKSAKSQELDNFKNTKNTELDNYKREKDLAINQYVESKNLEINDYVAAKNRELDEYKGAKDKEIDQYKNTKDKLINDKISEVEAAKQNIVSTANNKVSEMDQAKTNMQNSVNSKIEEADNRITELQNFEEQLEQIGADVEDLKQNGVGSDSVITIDKFDNTLKSALKNIGMQEILWEIGKRAGSTIMNDKFCALSNLIYFNAGDTIEYDNVKTTSAYKLTCYSEDGLTYDSSNSTNTWQRNNFTIQTKGYYYIHISYSPTSTTEITESNLNQLTSSIKINTSYVNNIDGGKIKDKTLNLKKFSDDIFKDNLKITSSFKQNCIGGFGFGYGIVDNINKGVVRHDNFYTLSDLWGFGTTSNPRFKANYWGLMNYIPEWDTLSYLSDICVVDDELWCFSTGVDDRSEYGVVWRIKYNPVDNLMEMPKFFWCNFGHINTVNYNSVSDSLIFGNGSGDYNLENKIYIISNVRKIKELENGAIVNLEDYGIEIDATGYDFGKKLNVFWANIKSVNMNYSGSEKYMPNVAYAYANDVNKMYIVAFGYSSYKYQYGTYQEPSKECIWNGTFNILATYQIGDENEVIGNPGSYSHCGQGGDSLNGVAYIGLGHSARWWTEICLGANSTFNKKDVWQPSFNPKTGMVVNEATRGIAVTNDYIIIAQGTNIYYLPR